MAKNVCIATNLGLVDYGEVWDLQRRLHGLRIAGEIDDVLLTLEHQPVLTLGKSGSLSNVLVSPERLADMGISLYHIERGGDVTYHGPGQLVAYPIIDLRRRDKDISRFVTDLEEVIIRTVGDFSIEAGRDAGHRGVWIDNQELAAIGLSVRKWVSMHGVALNVGTDLTHFQLINPCGFTDRRATSMAQYLSRDISFDSVRKSLLRHFADVFDVRLSLMAKPDLTALAQKTAKVPEDAGGMKGERSC